MGHNQSESTRKSRIHAGKLNSNEEFHPDRGFQVEVVVVRMPAPGSGRGRQREVGFRAWETGSKRKQTIIPIKNHDALCCARAIVTMRAWIHRYNPGHMPRSDWNALRDGYPHQGVKARELHQAAGVPEGPCGLPELEAFQRYLSPTYQLKVMSRRKPFFIIFRGPEAPNIIRLLKSEHHYEGCKSFKGFTNRSYWCDLCDRGFNDNDAANHPCEGRTCRACQRTSDHPCPTTTPLNDHPFHAPGATLSSMGQPAFSIISHPIAAQNIKSAPTAMRGTKSTANIPTSVVKRNVTAVSSWCR